MEKEFIPYEHALALKELKFDEPCFGYYVGKDKEVYMSSEILSAPFQFRLESKTTFVAPTFSQAFRWFRDKYELFFNIYSSDPARNDVYWNIYIFGKTKNRQDIKLEYVSMIYEEAEFECLKKLIEIVKNK